MEHESQPPPIKAAVIFLVLVVAIVAALTFKREPQSLAPTEGPSRITVTKPIVDRGAADRPASHLLGRINHSPTVEIVAEDRPPVDLSVPPPELPATFSAVPVAADSDSNPTTAVGRRTHRVLDGDTLESLAARFLGDPARAQEILAANQQLITNPELLPIGVELVIPPARVESAPDNSEELAPVAPSNAASR